MSDYEKAADLIDKAADHIEEKGWHQGAYAPEPDYNLDVEQWPDLPKCMAGGLIAATGMKMRFALGDWTLTPVECSKADDAYTLAFDLLNRQVRSIPGFNDRPGRTQQEVLDAMRLASKEARLRADQEARGE